MRTVLLETYLNAPADRVWEAVNTPRLLAYAAWPILRFAPVTPKSFPDRWADGAYVVRLWFLGILPIGKQVVDVSRPVAEGPTRFIRDNGRSAIISRWDHLISITQDGAGTRYVDQIQIDAGFLTPFVAAFAQWFYAHRQRRWRKLVDAGFDFDAA